MLLQILTLLGSLAMFLYGMSLMSGGLQKMAGNRMADMIDSAYSAMDHNLSTPLIELREISNAEEAERAINNYRDQLRTEHFSNIEKSSYPYETGSFYMDVINCLEKMGDFIINISQSVLEAKVA